MKKAFWLTLVTVLMILFAWLGWPTPYRYEHLRTASSTATAHSDTGIGSDSDSSSEETEYLVRINRLTGEVCITCTLDGWPMPWVCRRGSISLVRKFPKENDDK